MRELEILLVLFGERGHPDRDAGEVDALVFAEHAAVDDLAYDVVAVDRRDAQFDEAVGEQDAGARLEIFGQGREGGADQVGGAGDLARRDGERLPGVSCTGLLVLRACRCGSWGPAGRRGCRCGLPSLLRDLADHLDEFELSAHGCRGRSSGGQHRGRRAPVGGR